MDVSFSQRFNAEFVIDAKKMLSTSDAVSKHSSNKSVVRRLPV